MLNITEVTTKIDQSDLTEEAKRILIDVVEGCTEANGERADRGDVLDLSCTHEIPQARIARVFSYPAPEKSGAFLFFW